MLRFSAQAENLKMIEESVKSHVDAVRFGSELCERKIPSLQTLKKAYSLIEDHGKEFIYVTPRLPDRALEKIREHVDFLSGREAKIVVNDLGLLNVLSDQPGLNLWLGRFLVYIPARCPWRLGIKDLFYLSLSIKLMLDRRKVADLFYQTNLNYEPTIELFKQHGIVGVDLDWIPKCFKSYQAIADNGLQLSIHLYMIPVALTRKCHTARFLGIKRLDKCDKPCYNRFFRIVHDKLGVEMFLFGNAVFRLEKPSPKDLEKLNSVESLELVIPVNPITKTTNYKEINNIIRNLKST